MEHHTLGCVIFDLDGTLLDSMNVWSQIDRNLLNHYGKTAPDDLTEQVKKMTIQQSAQYFIDRFQLPCQPEEFIALVQSMAADAYRNAQHRCDILIQSDPHRDVGGIYEALSACEAQHLLQDDGGADGDAFRQEDRFRAGFPPCYSIHRHRVAHSL